MKAQDTYNVSNLDMNSTYFTIPSPSIGTFFRNESNSWSVMFSSNLPSMAARNCCWVRRPESLRSMLLKKKEILLHVVNLVKQYPTQEGPRQKEREKGGGGGGRARRRCSLEIWALSLNFIKPLLCFKPKYVLNFPFPVSEMT